MNDIENAIVNLKQIQSTEKPYGRLWKMCQESITALQKQIPKKTNIFTNKDDVKIGKFTFKAGCTIHKCPVCESNIAYGNYCYNCGQLLERSQE